MRPEIEDHLGRILINVVNKTDAKYRKGQKEHGGNLMQFNALQLIDHAIEESIDMIVYLESLREVIVGQS